MARAPLITLKLQKAIPALNGFSDAEAKRYVKAAIRNGRGARLGIQVGAALLGLVLAVALTVGVVSLINAVPVLNPNTARRITIFHVALFSVMYLIAFAPPFISPLIARDMIIRRAVRVRLGGAGCPICDHSLEGLPEIYDESLGREILRCPECGGRVPVRSAADGDRPTDAADRIISERNLSADDAEQMNDLLRRFPELMGLDTATQYHKIAQIEAGGPKRQRIAVGAGLAAGGLVALAIIVASRVLLLPAVEQNGLFVSRTFISGLTAAVALLLLWFTAAWVKRGVRGALTATAANRVIHSDT